MDEKRATVIGAVLALALLVSLSVIATVARAQAHEVGAAGTTWRAGDVVGPELVCRAAEFSEILASTSRAEYGHVASGAVLTGARVNVARVVVVVLERWISGPHADGSGATYSVWVLRAADPTAGGWRGYVHVLDSSGPHRAARVT